MAGLHISRSGDWSSVAQVVRVESDDVVELFICSRPAQTDGGFLEQAHSMYGNLRQLLQTQGASPKDVITEKVFFSDVDLQFHDLKSIRGDCYNPIAGAEGYVPATLFLHQPPCHPGRLCELQAYALVPRGDTELKVRMVNGMPGLASGKVVEYGGYRHLYLMNMTGGEDPEEVCEFSFQGEKMFTRAETYLRKEGVSFRDVIRTWIYIKDIERNYDTFNQVRNRFNKDHGITRLPASTGIQGTTYPKEQACTMDLYTVQGDRPVEFQVMHAPTLNEAHVYGSAFSRGMKVTLADRILLFVSGTASIDTEGQVVHVGDIQGQVNRMLLNVEQLLAGQGATFKDLVTAITYLKEPGYLDTFYNVCRERAFPNDISNTVSVADICRPEWLCEVEALAVLPR